MGVLRRRQSSVAAPTHSPPGSPPRPTSHVQPHPVAHSGSPQRASQAAAPAAPAPSRGHNLFLRLAVAIPMIIAFFFYCWATRQLGVVALIFALQAFIYAELVHVAIREAQEAQTPGFSALYYYWFGVAAFFMYARVLWPYMQDSSSSSSGGSGSGASSSLGDSSSAAHSGLWGGSTSLPSLALYALCWLVEKHVPVAFALYCVGVVLFVISLRRRRNFKYQFAQLAYCHIALLAVVGQSTLLAANAFHGLVWVLLPTGLIIVNDSFAYLAGITFGRTPLIRLSPKKTVEGFIGGALATLVFALLFVALCTELQLHDFHHLMLCPVGGGGLLGWRITHCDVSRVAGGLFVFKPIGAHAGWLGSAARALLSQGTAASISVSEAQLHACLMGLFAAFIAPFGGFLASGFKRAFRIKDFSSLIPGHGGFTDRFDCQLLMGAFAYVYLNHIIMTREEDGSGAVGHFFTAIRQSLSREEVGVLMDKLREL